MEWFVGITLKNLVSYINSNEKFILKKDEYSTININSEEGTNHEETSEQRDDEKTASMIWQEIFKAFHKFKETKNFELFRGLGFDQIIDEISNITKDFKKSEEEKFIIEFEEFGKCSENFFQKNIDKISLCFDDKRKCPLSKAKSALLLFLVACLKILVNLWF